MPFQGSWVELWLDRYCEPGKHDFRPVRADVLECARCRKQELAGGATCLFCAIPGERASIVERVDGQRIRLSGRLCGSCLDDFAERGTIRGWRLAA